MNTQNFLARKFLSGKNRSWYFSSLTLMGILGVLVSVLAFVVVQSVMMGFNQDLQEKILGFSSHLILKLKPGSETDPSLENSLKQNPEVLQVHRYVEGEAVLRTLDGENAGVRVRGIEGEPSIERDTLKVFFEEGEDWSSFNDSNSDLPGILLGGELAATLGVVPALMEKIELLFPIGEVGPSGEVEPNIRAFRVLGTFRSGYYQFDSKYVLIPIQDGRFLFGDQAQDQIGLFVKDPHRIENFLKGFHLPKEVDRVVTWKEQHSRLFHALKLERLGMYFVLGLMLVLASFNILSMLMMVVFERRREIAVLRALGLSERGIGGIFYRSGFWIGTIGGTLGVGLGILICLWLESTHLQLPSTYYLDALPVTLSWTFLLAAFLGAIFLSLVATIFPAREGKRVSVVEALRYE